MRAQSKLPAAGLRGYSRSAQRVERSRAAAGCLVDCFILYTVYLILGYRGDSPCHRTTLSGRSCTAVAAPAVEVAMAASDTAGSDSWQPLLR